MAIVIRKKLVLNTDNSHPNSRVIIKQFCIDTVELIIAINDKGALLELPAGTTARFKMLKADGTQYNDVCNVSGNNIVVEIEQQMQTAVGEGICEVIIFNGGRQFTSATFPLTIEKSVHDDSNLVSTDTFGGFLEALVRVENAAIIAEKAYEIAIQIEKTEVERVASEKTRKASEIERNSNENARKTDEIERKTSEVTRKTSEIDRNTNENTRKMDEIDRNTNENTRKADEIERISNENTRKADEIERISNENTRKADEIERILNENTRKADEIERILNENTRKASEIDRNTNENTRKTSEIERNTNENERITSEVARVENEKGRVADEYIRKVFEDERIDFEVERRKSETFRTENENERNINETTRIANENDRLGRENNRITAEEIRISQELIRESQEDIRELVTADALEETELAKERAILAAKSCEDIASGIIELPNIGSQGTYTKVQTDEKGRVINGYNPLCINELGIEDVYSKNEVDFAIAGVSFSNATETEDGLMSSQDKVEVNKIKALEKEKLNKDGDTKDNTVSFSINETDEDIFSGEDHGTIVSKIVKSIKTFKNAISELNTKKIDKANIVNNGVTTEEGTVLDGKMGKTLTDYINNLNKNSISGKDLNDIKNTGFYYGFNFTNGAENNISVFTVQEYSIDWVYQEQIVLSAVPVRYMRAFHSGTTWSAWVQISNLMNIGTPVTYTVTTGFTTGWSGTISYNKSRENLVKIKMVLIKDSDISSNENLYTLPVGFIPTGSDFASELIHLLTNSGGGIANSFARIIVNGAGVISVIPIVGTALTGARRVFSVNVSYYA